MEDLKSLKSRIEDLRDTLALPWVNDKMGRAFRLNTEIQLGVAKFQAKLAESKLFKD